MDMKIYKAIKLFLKDSDEFLIRFLRKNPFLSSDKFYLKTIYKQKLGRNLNLENPQTYNEKLQWLKLYYHNPLLTTLVDKIKVKNFVADKIGEEYVIPTLGVWDSFEEIDFDQLPQQFVLKTNHDYGGVVICKDKANFDFGKAKEKLNRHLKRNFFYAGREWAYKNVKPRIFAEKYFVDESKTELKDYKFFCFDGKPKLLYVGTGRQINLHFTFFDLNFKRLNIDYGPGPTDKNISKPINFDKMISLAEKLSEGLPHVRVDLYNIKGEIYFGELTLYSMNGTTAINPKKWDYELGSYLSLPKKWV